MSLTPALTGETAVAESRQASQEEEAEEERERQRAALLIARFFHLMFSIHILNDYPFVQARSCNS